MGAQSGQGPSQRTPDRPMPFSGGPPRQNMSSMMGTMGGGSPPPMPEMSAMQQPLQVPNAGMQSKFREMMNTQPMPPTAGAGPSNQLGMAGGMPGATMPSPAGKPGGPPQGGIRTMGPNNMPNMSGHAMPSPVQGFQPWAPNSGGFNSAPPPQYTAFNANNMISQRPDGYTEKLQGLADSQVIAPPPRTAQSYGESYTAQPKRKKKGGK